MYNALLFYFPVSDCEGSSLLKREAQCDPHRYVLQPGQFDELSALLLQP